MSSSGTACAACGKNKYHKGSPAAEVESKCPKCKKAGTYRVSKASCPKCPECKCDPCNYESFFLWALKIIPWMFYLVVGMFVVNVILHFILGRGIVDLGDLEHVAV